MINRLLLVAFGVSLASASALGTNLTLTAVADDTFVAYVSTNPTVEGTQFLSQVSTWQAGTVNGSVTLTPGVTNYINIRAFDVFGAPSMLIGQLLLDDNAFVFNDNSSSIVTANDVNWTASLAGWGGTPTSITDIGPNGQGPWSFFNTLPANARQIWTPGGVSEVRYFQVQVNAVPEPASLIALGLGAVALLRRRK
ncbi:MAG: PEP-CTERM sorting domain-containing protein [Fimbriimonadaceae bacterium]|nr:PEP-CTERM sorting domain-containing protein [Fimbriimonadaceae bacterium]